MGCRSRGEREEVKESVLCRDFQGHWQETDTKRLFQQKYSKGHAPRQRFFSFENPAHKNYFLMTSVGRRLGFHTSTLITA